MYGKKITQRLFSLMAFVATAAFVALGSGAAAADTVDLPVETVVGSFVGEADEDKYMSPGVVTVVRPGEKKGEQRTVPELLEDVPGLQVIRSRGRHGYTVASVRGSTSSQVAVYVDGVLMNLQSEAAVDLSAIPVDNVERIEVYRGYIPARFGASAMGGVINIVTKTPAEPETNISFGVGSFGKYKSNFSYGAPVGGGSFFGSFGYESYDGDYKYWNDNGTPFNTDDDYTGKRRDNGFENMDLLLKWQDENWRAKVSWVRNDRDLALSAPGLDKPDVVQQQGALLDTERWDLLLGRVETSGSVNWGWELTYADQSKNYDSRRGSGLSSIGGMTVTRSSYDTTRWSAALNADWSMGERHFVEARLSYADERLKVGGDTLDDYLGGISRYDSDEWSASIQDTIALDRAGSLLAIPSVRWYKQEGDDKFTWQVAVTKELGQSWMLKSAYGTYARAPNLYERYGDGAFILPSENGLKWETGEQFDIGASWSRATERARSNVALTYFWRDSDDLIEFGMESPRYGRYINIGRAKVKGVELEAGFDWEKWNMTLSGTWMEGKNYTDDASSSARYYGKALPNRPEWSANARLTRKFGKGSVFVEYQYIGENYADSSEKVLFDDRNIWNLGVKYRLSPTTQLSLGVNDLFDEADDWRMRPDGANGPVRMLWYPIEGRSYYLTMTMEL